MDTKQTAATLKRCYQKLTDASWTSLRLFGSDGPTLVVTAERVKLCVVPVGFLDLFLFMCTCVLVRIYAHGGHKSVLALEAVATT